MTDGLGELTTLCVKRFWKFAKETGCHRERSLERALIEISTSPQSVCSKVWGAVLLHSSCVDRTHFERVASSLSCGAGNDFPPAEIAQIVGFVRYAGVDAAPSRSHIDILTDPLKAFIQLQTIPKLNDQTIGEIVLAIAGNKMSRIVANSGDLDEIGAALNLPVFISSCGHQPIPDKVLNNFSNIVTRTGNLTSLSGDAHGYAYFGGDVGDQALLSVLDQLNSAGKYLGIPDCCRTHFAQHWDDVCAKHDGDMGYFMFAALGASENEMPIRPAWQCNPYGMYQGGGMLWHFPCGFECEATIKIIDDRINFISIMDSAFSGRCRLVQSTPFTIMPDRSVSLHMGHTGGMSRYPR